MIGENRKIDSIKQILIVDDDDNFRENYRELLEDQGYAVFDCGSPRDAISTFDENHIDLVILDVSMYGDRFAGHKLCTAIKALCSEVPIVMLTSFDGKDNRSIALANGVAGYWIKSANTDEFVNNVNSMLV